MKSNMLNQYNIELCSFVCLNVLNPNYEINNGFVCSTLKILDGMWLVVVPRKRFSAVKFT